MYSMVLPTIQSYSQSMWSRRNFYQQSIVIDRRYSFDLLWKNQAAMKIFRNIICELNLVDENYSFSHFRLYKLILHVFLPPYHTNFTRIFYSIQVISHSFFSFLPNTHVSRKVRLKEREREREIEIHSSVFCLVLPFISNF